MVLAFLVDLFHHQWLLLVILIPPKPMTVTRKLKFLILLVLIVWQRERTVLNIKIPYLQNATTALLGRSHAAVLGRKLQTSGGTCGVRSMGILENSSQFLRPLILMRDVARWTNVRGPIPVCGRPIYSSSGVPTSRINAEGIVKRIRQISDSPPDPDAEGNDELDGEIEVVPNSAGPPFNTYPSQPPAKRVQSQVITSKPRTFQPTLATIPTSIPPASPHSSHIRPAMNPEVKIFHPAVQELTHSHLSACDSRPEHKHDSQIP
ncbi:hypothetical protein O181_080586 [Austropuccinia psidii MF-1]|uniref:Uncharacterized protein n=1 Tax=Austropuccinia psidii MF-1 TaxID=1389203 RepID=A0A9Q3FIH6_9BASI|nr:hypothetical protein [Austropuccinia psidii MF-1]